MKKMILLAIGLVLSGAAHGAVSAKYSSHNNSFAIDRRLDSGAEVYYNCDVVEDTAQSILKKMGASRVQARCSGGIVNGHLMDAYLDLNFTSLKTASAGQTGELVQADFKHIVLKGFDNCALVKSIVNKVKNNFEVKNLVSHRSCSLNNGSYNFEMDVLVAQ